MRNIEKIEKTIKFTSMVVGSLLSILLGGIDSIAKFLLIMILLDITSGIMKGIYYKKLKSEKMYIGAMKKISILLVVYVTTIIDSTFNSFVLRDSVIIYFITYEGLSFIENISTFIELPNQFIEFFEQNKEE